MFASRDMYGICNLTSSLMNSKTKIIIGLGVVTLSGFGCYFLYRKRRFWDAPPAKWRHVGRLEEIVQYPLKSCRGTVLDLAKCEYFGIRCENFNDRMLVLIDKDGKIGSAGKYPKMLQIETEIIGADVVMVTALGMEPLEIDLRTLTGEQKLEKVDGCTVPIVYCDPHHGKWFSQFLCGKDEGFTLAYCPTPVLKDTILWKQLEEPNFYMALTTKSIDDLNSRLKNKIHHRQFRGNLLVRNDNGEPYEEDNWKWMKIGDSVVFRYKAPCLRCILPNINIFTAERDPHCEPLRTLKKYRMMPGEKEPVMGAYFRLHSEGTIRLGDDVFVA